MTGPGGTESRALVEHYPRRIDVPLLIVASAVLLVFAYLSPTLSLTKVIFFTDEYSIWGGIVELWQSEHPVLAVVVFVFSMVFPIAKLLALTVAWVVPMSVGFRNGFAGVVGQLGKWSMLDVFIVAMLVVLVKAKDLADAEAKIGIYLFGGAVLTSMFASLVVERLARRAERDPAGAASIASA